MSLFWPSIVTIHLLAAVTWIGGMVFLSSVLSPLLRSESVTAAQVELFRSAARRFRLVVWLSICSLVITGPVLLHEKNIPLTVPTDWPVVLRIKLGLVALLLLLTTIHGLYSGPRGGRVEQIPAGAPTPVERMLVVIRRSLGRLSLFVALAVMVAAVILARS